MEPDDGEMLIRHDPANQRYVAEIDGTELGSAVYELRSGRRLLTHTEVADEFGGRGVASALARYALDDARAEGLAVVPVCPFMAHYIERHPEYGDLVAGDRPEPPSR